MNEPATVLRRLSQLIKQRRKQLHLSQDDVATGAGLSRSYYSDVERGLRNISIDTLERIGLALNTRASEIVKLAEEMPVEAIDSEQFFVGAQSR